MNLLPHIFVLDHIRKTMEEIKSNPFVIEFILGGLATPGGLISQTYGARYIDQAIKALSEMDWHYCLGYRLDITRLPNISVMLDGGTEAQQFMGDYGHVEQLSVPRRKYGTFTADHVFEKEIFVNDRSVLDKIWRTQKLVAPLSNKAFTIVDILDFGSGTVKITVDSDLDYDADGLIGWGIYGPSSYDVITVGESLDKVSIKVYADVPGDPELCEIINCVLRYIVKQARIPLTDNGLNVPTINYRPIAKNESYPNQNVWTSEVTISGQLTDQWILAKTSSSDKMGLNITAISSNPSNLPVDLTIE